MEQHQPANQHPHPHPHPHPQQHSLAHLQNIQPPNPAQIPQRTASSTPVSSPGLFSPTASRLNMAFPSQPQSEGTSPVPNANSPFLHPLQTRRVRETYTALVDRDYATGRKHINQYEVMEEIGRGQHGKVKLARNTDTGENVAIKIIPRYSKKRRLGKVTAEDPQRNTKREIAILKKIRHPNVVALLEVIDDPELKKIYMVLEHVELGEITWRKKGLPHICQLERRLVERGMRHEPLTAEEEEYMRHLERKQAVKELKRSRAQQQTDQGDYWSLEYGTIEEDDVAPPLRHPRTGPAGNSSLPGSRTQSQAPSRTQSAKSLSRLPTTPHPSRPPQPSDAKLSGLASEGGIEVPAPLRPNAVSPSALEGTMYGGAYAGAEEAALRARSPSMADSIISLMSSVDFSAQPHDPFVDDFSYVPCFTMDDARSAFRDTVLGLEYLHYNGVVHRDIKPANLLWTKDFRVKISDFGVSYFGRPIREGEPDDLVSESEALDFDDDRELAKTVGTPAFFAPELCYTDLDKEKQPRVSEQIDVWSLGVTLYCIIFARIPFLAEDEFSMFKKIATEDAYIPRRRLRPVSPFTDPTKVSLYKRANSESYRADEDASYEDIDDDLYDLLRRMLIKNPEQRIRLRDVKCHPWLVRGISNINSWMDETDPSRKMSGRQIEVDEREIGRAVVPLTFLERAKSTLKKAVGKVIHPRADRGEGSSRRRAASSATGSAGDSVSVSVSNASSSYPRDIRRKSLRGDDYFATVTQMPSEHPLSQSVAASPLESPLENSPNSPNSLNSPDVSESPNSPAASLSAGQAGSTGDVTERQTPTLPHKMFPWHAHARSMGNTFLSLTPSLAHSQTVPTSPSVEETMTMHDGASRVSVRKGREQYVSDEGSSRARSMDRAGLIFPSSDKHAEAKVALSTVVAPGSMQQPPPPRHLRQPRQMRSIDLGSPGIDRPVQLSPTGLLPQLAAVYQQVHHPKSETNIREKRRSMIDIEERPLTAHRIEGIHEVQQQQQQQAESGRQHLAIRTAGLTDPVPGPTTDAPTDTLADAAGIPCPPSPRDEERAQSTPNVPAPPPSGDGSMSTAISSSFISLRCAVTTPMTSPSIVASPECQNASARSSSRGATDAMLAFQSDPSLPALLSGASSVSADMEGDFLGNPGVVNRSSLIAASDSLTPPAPAKDSLSEFPMEHQDMDSLDTIAVHLDGAKNGQSTRSLPPNITSSRALLTDDEDGSDSDSDGEGLLMMRAKKKAPPRGLAQPFPFTHHHQHDNQHEHQQHLHQHLQQHLHQSQQNQHQRPHQHQHVPMGSLAHAARRRDTNTSIGSTETAKKVEVNGAETHVETL